MEKTTKWIVGVILLAVLAMTIWYFAGGKQINIPEDEPMVGTVLHFKFDGDAKATVGPRDGIVIGAAKPTGDKKVGTGAFEFTGAEGAVSAGTSSTFDSTDKVSVSAWVKYDTLRHSYVVHKDGAYLLQLYPADSAANRPWQVYGGVYVDDTVTKYSEGKAVQHLNLVGTGLLETGKWYHIVFIYDRTVASGPSSVLYLNGQLVSSNTKVKSAIVNTPNKAINVGGRNEVGWDRNTDGVIDDVRVFNRALTAEEVLQLYNAGTTTVAGSIVDAGVRTD